jgi:hypothetical protein
VGNIIWLLFASWWLALLHLLSAVLLAITVIGLPLAVANMKLVPAALWPFGREIVRSADVVKVSDEDLDELNRLDDAVQTAWLRAQAAEQTAVNPALEGFEPVVRSEDLAPSAASHRVQPCSARRMRRPSSRSS